MKHKLLIALLSIGLLPSLLFAQLYKMDVDTQDAAQNRVIDRVFTGNTIGLQVSFFEDGVALPVTNWNMRFQYGKGRYDTNGMVPVVGTNGAASNIVIFRSATNAFYSENDNYYFSIVGTNSAGEIRTFARGRMIEEYDPATGGGGGYVLPMPWGSFNFVTIDDVISLISTSEIETVVAYGVASNTAYRGDWGASVSNTAAAASSTGTAAYALAAGKVSANHTGNVSVIGRVGIGTNAVTACPPTRTNAANLLHLVDGGIYLEDKPHLLGGGSATSQTAAIFLGYDAREFGRPALWLNSYDYESGGNTYDAASDIYFGKGASFTDASLRWGLSSRPTNQGWGHESSGQFLIYEFPGLGSSGVGGTRFSILPDSGGIGGPIKLGTETRYPPPSPDPAATLVVNDWTKSPVVILEGNTNAGAASFPRIRFIGGTNVADVTWSNGVLHSSASLAVPQIALGTNPAAGDWPTSGAADGGATNSVITLNGANYAASYDAVTRSFSNNLGTITGTGGITNNQAPVTLGGTFTGEHVGNGASLTNLTDATARASIIEMGDAIHPRILASVTNGTATLWASSSAWYRVNCDTNALTNWVIDTTGVSAVDTIAMAVEIYRPNANTWAWMPGVTNSSPATNATTLNCFVLISGSTNWLVNP